MWVYRIAGSIGVGPRVWLALCRCQPFSCSPLRTGGCDYDGGRWMLVGVLVDLSGCCELLLDPSSCCWILRATAWSFGCSSTDERRLTPLDVASNYVRSRLLRTDPLTRDACSAFTSQDTRDVSGLGAF